MQIKFNLKKVLVQHGLAKHGIKGRLANDLGIHRHTVRKLINGDVESISLKILSDLCQWLQARGDVPAEVLPQALFDFRPDALWSAVARTKIVRIYLGEYQQIGDPAPIRLWINRRDSVVAAAIVEALHTCAKEGVKPPIVHSEYVPFSFANQTPVTKEEHFEEDTHRAKRMFKQTRAQGMSATRILVGSQYVNYLVECYFADLFGAVPFKPPGRKPVMPIYMRFRDANSSMQSCFGGLAAPPGSNDGDGSAPGMYYLDEKNRWVCCPWVRRQEDSGLVTVLRDPGAGLIEIVMFGFSGRATACMATEVVRKPQPFWPPYFHWQGRELGVYICKFKFSPDDSRDAHDVCLAKPTDIVPLDAKVLARYL